MGDMYHAGAFPRLLPDNDAALECYKYAARCPDGDVAGTAQTKYVAARDDPVQDEGDLAGTPMPRVFAERACAIAQDAFLRTPADAFGRPRNASSRETARERRRRRRYIGRGGENAGLGDDQEEEADPLLQRVLLDQWRGGPAADAATAAAVAGEILPAYRADTQNVHDHGVSSATAHNLRSLQQRQTRQDRDQTSVPSTKEEETEEARVLREVERGVEKHPELPEAVKEDARRVLDQLHGSEYGVHSTYGKTERGALATVWKRIRDEERPDVRDNLTETLGKQLASAIEHGAPVCSSGKIARIVGTLDGTANEAVAAPMWAVREEIASLAAKVSEEGERDGASDDQQRDTFVQRARQEYVDKLGMSPAVVGGIIDEFSLGF